MPLWLASHLLIWLARFYDKDLGLDRLFARISDHLRQTLSQTLRERDRRHPRYGVPRSRRALQAFNPKDGACNLHESRLLFPECICDAKHGGATLGAIHPAVEFTLPGFARRCARKRSSEAACILRSCSIAIR